MRILRIAFSIPPYHGGMENHILQLSREQRKMGHEVSLYYVVGKDDNPSDLRFLRPVFRKVQPAFFRYFLFYLAVICHFLLHRKQYDVVHAHGDWSSFIWLPILRRLTSARVIAASHHGSIQGHGLRYRLLKISLKNVDTVFFTGYEPYSALRESNHAVFQPSGVNDIFFESQEAAIPQTIDVILIAYFRKEKNIMTLLKVAEALPDLKFVIIGGGVERATLQNYIVRKRISNVTLEERCLLLKLRYRLAQSRLFVLPSLQEGTPTVLMEAMAMGLPLVCTRIAGLDHFLVENKNCLFIDDPYAVDEYSAAIRHILSESPELYLSISKNNRCSSDRFRWKQVAENITNHYHSIINPNC